MASSGEDPKIEKAAAVKEEGKPEEEGEQMDMDKGGGERGRANSDSGEVSD